MAMAMDSVYSISRLCPLTRLVIHLPIELKDNLTTITVLGRTHILKSVITNIMLENVLRLRNRCGKNPLAWCGSRCVLMNISNWCVCSATFLTLIEHWTLPTRRAFIYGPRNRDEANGPCFRWVLNFAATSINDVTKNPAWSRSVAKCQQKADICLVGRNFPQIPQMQMTGNQPQMPPALKFLTACKGNSLRL